MRLRLCSRLHPRDSTMNPPGTELGSLLLACRASGLLLAWLVEPGLDSSLPILSAVMGEGEGE